MQYLLGFGFKKGSRTIKGIQIVGLFLEPDDSRLHVR